MFAQTFVLEGGKRDLSWGTVHTSLDFTEVLHKQSPNDKVTLGIHFYVTAAGIAVIRLR